MPRNINKYKWLVDIMLKRVYNRGSHVHTRISLNLANEIKQTQKLMKSLQGNKKKPVSLLRASDFMAEIYRKERLKIKNERR